MFLIVGVVLAAALGVGLFTSLGTSAKGGRPAIGEPAPTFSLQRLVGPGTVGTPADGGGNGRPAILLFFASWCGPCQKEIPAVAAAYRHGGGATSPVAVIGVDTLDPANGVSFVRTSGVTFPVGADRAGGVTQGLYAFSGDPESVFIRGDGTIAGIEYGALSVSQFQSWEHRLTAS